MKKLAVVGIFYDGYVDLWIDFINLYYKHWSDSPYQLYIVNNQLELPETNPHAGKFKVLHAGADAEYSKKVQLAVEQIDADYLLLLLEDFFIAKPLNANVLKEVMDFVEQEKIEYYTMPMPEFVDIRERKTYGNRKDIFRLSKSREYLFSCQPSIWKKEFLRLCIGTENYNAWIFEGIYARSTAVRDQVFLQKSAIDYNNPLCLCHGAVQGMMLPSAMKKIADSGYELTSKRAIFQGQNSLKRKLRQTVVKCLKLLHLGRLKDKLYRGAVLNKFSDQIEFFAEHVISKKKVDAYLKEYR